MENKILAAMIASKEAYVTVRDYVSPETLSPAGSTILKFMDSYYDTDGVAECCDVDVLRQMVTNNVTEGAMQDQMQETLGQLIDKEVSVPNVVKQVLNKQRKDRGQELAQAILTSKPSHIVQDLVEEYSKIVDKQTLEVTGDEEYRSPNLAELFSTKFSTENTLQLAPKSLNDKLGGRITKGRHIVVGARPEAGKTAFSINLACAIAYQDKTVLYYANEEPIVDIIVRCVANLSGMGTTAIKENPEHAQELATRRGFDNIVFVYADSNTPWEIQALARKHKPDAIIVDQLRNLNLKTDGLTELLERACKKMRDIAAECNCLIVSITQAGDSAEGKAILSMSDIDSSKTGVQGACDVMILMGKSAEMASTGRRCLNLVKNKVSGDHSAWYVNINEPLSRITD